MKFNNQPRHFAAVITIGLAVIVSGCAALPSLVQNRAVPIAFIQRGNGLYLSWATAHHHNDTLIVQGALGRPHLAPAGQVKTCVDISVFGPAGDILAEKEVRTSPEIPHRHHSLARFTASLDIAPPSGSTIRLAAHRGPHKSTGMEN